MKTKKSLCLLGLFVATSIYIGCDVNKFKTNICNVHPEYLCCGDGCDVVDVSVSLANPTFHVQLQYPANGFDKTAQESDLKTGILQVAQEFPDGSYVKSASYPLRTLPVQHSSPNVYEYTVTLSGDEAKKFKPTTPAFVEIEGDTYHINLPIAFVP